MRTKLVQLLVSLPLMASCGGSDKVFVSGPTQEEEYVALLAQSSESFQEARALASTEPCSTSSQCSVLVLQSRVAPCNFRTIVDYSLVSSTAQAASAAAARYNQLQEQASSIAPPSNTIAACVERVDLTPLNCVANRCVRQFVFAPG